MKGPLVIWPPEGCFCLAGAPFSRVHKGTLYCLVVAWFPGSVGNMWAPSQPHDQPRVDSWSPKDPPDMPMVLLSLEAVGKNLQLEQAGPPVWAKGLLTCRPPVCWGPFLFSSRLALGTLGGSGLLYWAGCTSRWKPREGRVRGRDLLGWWSYSQLQTCTFMSLRTPQFKLWAPRHAGPVCCWPFLLPCQIFPSVGWLVGWLICPHSGF